MKHHEAPIFDGGKPTPFPVKIFPENQSSEINDVEILCRERNPAVSWEKHGPLRSCLRNGFRSLTHIITSLNHSQSWTPTSILNPLHAHYFHIRIDVSINNKIHVLYPYDVKWYHKISNIITYPLYSHIKIWYIIHYKNISGSPQNTSYCLLWWFSIYSLKD